MMMMNTSNGNWSGRTRRVELFCPTVSKLVPLIALEEQKMDIGSIARMFGLDPNTVKFNGHFISRGPDLISSSVTWKSLLSFFASRGLSTGTSCTTDALIVDGKLSHKANCSLTSENEGCQSTEYNGSSIKRKAGIEDINKFKRLRINMSNPEADIPSSSCQSVEYNGSKRKPELEDFNVLKKKRINMSNPGAYKHSNCVSGDNENAKYNSFDLKRKEALGDVNLLKRPRINEDHSGSEAKTVSTISSAPFVNSCTHSSLNRSRGDEHMASLYPCKKIR